MSERYDEVFSTEIPIPKSKQSKIPPPPWK